MIFANPDSTRGRFRGHATHVRRSGCWHVSNSAPHGIQHDIHTGTTSKHAPVLTLHWAFLKAKSLNIRSCAERKTWRRVRRSAASSSSASQTGRVQHRFTSNRTRTQMTKHINSFLHSVLTTQQFVSPSIKQNGPEGCLIKTKRINHIQRQKRKSHIVSAYRDIKIWLME